MKSYEQLGCTLQALLKAGHQISITVQSKEGSPIGIIEISHEDLKEFHVKFAGGNTGHAQNVVDILRRYIGERKETTDQPVTPIVSDEIPREYELLRKMFPDGYFGY